MPRSRPRPLWRIPPNGSAVRTELFELTDSVPERIADATRQGAGAVAGPDRTRQPVDRGVGETDGVGFVGERGDGHHRTEDLLGHHPARRRAALHHRRGEPVAGTVRAVVAVQHRGRVVEERADPVVLTARDQRSHVGAVVRATDAPRGRRLDEALDEPVVRARLDEDAAARRSSPGRRCRTRRRARPRRRRRCRRRRTPPSPTCRRARARPASPSPRRRRGWCARPRVEPVKLTLSTSGWVARAAPVVGPRPGSTCSTPSPSPTAAARRPSSMLVSGVSSDGLRTHRVAGGERRRHLPRGDEQREVPRRDRRHHADRLLHGQRQSTGDPERAPADLVDGTGVEVEHVGHGRHLAPARPDRLAGVRRLHLGEHVALLADGAGERPQPARPLGWREAPPRRRGARRPSAPRRRRASGPAGSTAAMRSSELGSSTSSGRSVSASATGVSCIADRAYGRAAPGAGANFRDGPFHRSH